MDAPKYETVRKSLNLTPGDAAILKKVHAAAAYLPEHTVLLLAVKIGLQHLENADVGTLLKTYAGSWQRPPRRARVRKLQKSTSPDPRQMVISETEAVEVETTTQGQADAPAPQGPSEGGAGAPEPKHITPPPPPTSDVDLGDLFGDEFN